MANIASNIKSHKKDLKRRMFKISYKKKFKNITKLAFENKNVSSVYKILDSLQSKGLIKKNRCNKLKSKYTKKISDLKS